MRRINKIIMLGLSSILCACGNEKISSNNDISQDVSNVEQISSQDSNEQSKISSSSDNITPDDNKDVDILLDEDYTNIKKLDDITKDPDEVMMYGEDFFGVFDNIKYQQLYYNNVQNNKKKDGSVDENTDAKYLYYNDDYLRFVNRSEGYVFNFKTDYTLQGDFKRAKYRTKLYNKEVTIAVSHETSNPYISPDVDDFKTKQTKERKAWTIYRDEWIIRHVNNNQFLNENNISFAHDTVFENKELKEGYSLILISVVINDKTDIKKNYYNIGVIRNQYDTQGEDFYLFVMKSTTDRYEDFKEMILSFELLDETKGTPKNHYDNLEIVEDPNWNEETRNYYRQLVSQQRTGWGMFVANVQDEGTIEPRQQTLSDAYDYDFDIIPTYQHVSWNGVVQKFPLENSKKIAGGNGFNGKPVLQYTYQLTNNNNDVAGNSGSKYTPVFDIYRGKNEVFDLWSKKDRINEGIEELASNIKAYGKPVLFRLNNEMNTDWCSYSGIVTLCDPDIFIATWRKLYLTFRKRGVDNAIFIFNPIAKSCPFSSWGEDMSYFPGNEYNHVLGLTYYEDNNKNNVNEDTFRKDYTELYEKNNPVWNKYPWIISEFGCGAGGDVSGELGRNEESQSNYVRGMFKAFNDRENNKYLQNIKGAVWFSVNDYDAEGKIINLFNLIPPTNFPLTTKEFKEGLAPNKLN